MNRRDRFAAAWRLVVPALACVLACATPARAQDADEDFADFRIPDHRWRTGDLGLSGSFTRQRTGYDQVFDLSEWHESTRGVLSVRSAWWRFADPVQHRIEVSADFLGARDRGRVEAMSPPLQASRLEGSSETAVERWRLLAEWRRYPVRWPAAFGVRGGVEGTYEQFWRRGVNDVSAVQRTVEDENLETWEYLHRASADLFAGVGRVRDATGVYDAYVLERRLLDTGALTRPLAPATRRRLAALFYTEPTFATVFERPDRRFWREVERALEEDGALRADGMDASDLYRAAEGLGVVASVLRQHGFFLGPVLRAELTDAVTRRDQQQHMRAFNGDTLVLEQFFGYAQRFDRYDSQISAGVQGDYHRPFGWRWQFDAVGTILVPLQRVDEGLVVQSAATLGYLVADRWRAGARISHTRTYETPSTQPGLVTDMWIVTYGAGVTWYVEDRLKVSLDWSAQQTHDGAYTDYDARDDVLYLTLGYAFMRGLEAPGLFEPQRVP